MKKKKKKYPPGHLAVRNLTRQTLTLKHVEQFNVTVKDKAESKVESLTSNFTSLLKDAIPGGPAESSNRREKSAYHKLDNDAKAVQKDELDIRLEPFKAQQTSLKVGARRKELKVLRLSFENDNGIKYRLDVPGPSDESQTLKPLSPGAGKRQYTAIYNSDTGALAIFDTSNLSKWMREMPDHLSLSALSIPGTHNSPTCHSALPSVRCQAVSPAAQLENGVRFFDVRVQVEDPEKSDSDALHLVHSVFPISLTGSKHLRDLLDDIYSFLDKNPSETVVLCLKREGRGDGTDGQLADRLFGHYVKPKYWHQEPGIPNLGDARGKIVLMRRFGLSDRLKTKLEGRGFGINATNWGDNTADHDGGDVRVQDFYEVTDSENVDKKKDLICRHLERAGAVSANAGANGTNDNKRLTMPLFMNFMSGSHFWRKSFWPEKVAAKLNPAVTAFLCEMHDVKDETKGDGCTGIVVCDWVGEDGDWDLVRAIVGMNSRVLMKEQLALQNGQVNDKENREYSERNDQIDGSGSGRSGGPGRGRGGRGRGRGQTD